MLLTFHYYSNRKQFDIHNYFAKYCYQKTFKLSCIIICSTLYMQK